MRKEVVFYVVVPIVCVLLAGWIQWQFISKPQLIEAQAQTELQRRAKADSDKKLADEQKARETAEKQLQGIKDQWLGVRNHFVRDITRAITDATKPAAAWERTPRPSNEYLAKQIIDKRLVARDQIEAMKPDLQTIWENLDEDIDDLNKILNKPPVDQKRLVEALNRLAERWPHKMRLIDELASKLFVQLGCPKMFALNP